MKILITSAASSLAQRLATALAPEHQLRLTERTQLPYEGEFVCSPLGHDFSTNLLVRGMEAIIHVAEPLPAEPEEAQLDYLTRQTYNLLWAAAVRGGPRLIYLSTLELMTAQTEPYIVTEQWRPRPTTSARLLSRYLGESVCREFAREHRLTVVVLRLGRVVQAQAVAGQPFDPLWVDEQDVSQAVMLALTADLDRWSVFHIQADSSSARFPVGKAKKQLGYRPVVTFE